VKRFAKCTGGGGSSLSALFEAVEEAKVNAWDVGWAPELIVRKKKKEGGRRRNRRTSGGGIVQRQRGYQMFAST